MMTNRKCFVIIFDDPNAVVACYCSSEFIFFLIFKNSFIIRLFSLKFMLNVDIIKSLKVILKGVMC